MHQPANRNQPTENQKMKRLTAIIMSFAICAAAHASTIIFTGVVDSVNPDSQFQPGDAFVAKFTYYPHEPHFVNHATIIVGEQVFRFYADGGTRVSDDIDACSGSVFYQIVDSPYVEITLQAATPDCVVPPREQFNLNDFTFMFNTFGHLTGAQIVWARKAAP
jgi:hypothetical protein